MTTNTKTAFAYVPAIAHDLQNHPENATRGVAVKQLLEQQGVWSELVHLTVPAATDLQLMAAHDLRMLQAVQQVSLRGGGRIDQDTYATDESYDLALLAAGAVCKTIDAIMDGEVRNGFAFVRPPGHHAEFRRPGGFCLINNIAVGARHAQIAYGLDKVMIVDFDVHHGNGTQDIFYEDETVLFVSSHQHSPYFYPGSGSLQEIGRGKGSNFTLNVPLFPGVGDSGFAQIFDEVIIPRARIFEPDFILVSAGYDAHWVDPLASLDLSLTGYGRISQALVSLADELCQGRIAFVQEGGYVLDALANGVHNSIRALQGIDQIRDPLGPAEDNEPNITKLLSNITRLHLIK